MKHKIQLLVIIPARSQSKKLKNKNIRLLNNHPLVAYSIEAAKNIKEKSKIVHLSTDSKKISDVSKKYYEINDDLRPKKLAKDASLDIEFLNYTLNLYSKKSSYFKYCIILRPTNPIRKKKTLNYFYNSFKSSNFNSLKSIYKSPKTPYKMWIKKNRLITNIINNRKDEFFNYPRQKLPQTYYQTGTIEIIKINYKNKLKKFSGDKIMGIEVSDAESIDIDDINDLKIAEKMFEGKKFIEPKLKIRK
jgi:CMP-N-acetylneuraminic acid synthetase